MKFSEKSIFQELLDVFIFRAKIFLSPKNFFTKKNFFFLVGNVLKRTQKNFQGWEFFLGGGGLCIVLVKKSQTRNFNFLNIGFSENWHDTFFVDLFNLKNCDMSEIF